MYFVNVKEHVYIFFFKSDQRPKVKEF